LVSVHSLFTSFPIFKKGETAMKANKKQVSIAMVISLVLMVISVVVVKAAPVAQGESPRMNFGSRRVVRCLATLAWRVTWVRHWRWVVGWAWTRRWQWPRRWGCWAA
jgi:hypothetical protein